MIALVLAGLLLAASSPPWNHWFFAIIGLAILFRRIDKLAWRSRLKRGWLCGFVMFLVTLAWAQQFNFVGWILLSAVEALFMGVACALVPIGKYRRAFGFVGALVLLEALRLRIPFGGLPMGSFTTGQAGSPLAASASVVGELGLVAVVALCAVALSELVRVNPARWVMGWGSLITALVLVFGGTQVHVNNVGILRVATVQGGGPQAVTTKKQNPGRVLANQYSATPLVTAPVDLILWPEDSIEVHGPIADSNASVVLGDLARDDSTTIAAGVVEVNDGAHTFKNALELWGPDGNIVGRYEKRQRVPFGEYIPGRSFIKHVVSLSSVPDDAIAGTGAPTVTVNNRKLGTLISFESLFSRSARTAVRDGGEALLVPTNAASYKSTHVSTTQIEAARLRARETGRWVVQAAPTGRSAIIDDRGRIRQLSAIGAQSVLQGNITLSTTRTPYVHWGNTPMLIVSLLLLGLAWRGHTANRERGRGLGSSLPLT